MGLFKRVVARAVSRPGEVHRAVPVAAREPERALASCNAALLIGDAEHAAWRGRAGAFAGYGQRHSSAVAHVGGADGSAARTIPRDLPGPVILTLTDRRLVVSAEPAAGAPAVEIAAFDRSAVRWVARTGRQDASGVHVRCSLADESFFDVAVAPEQAALFLAATADLAR